MTDSRVSDVAFTGAVKAAQSARGSRAMFESRRDWRAGIDADLAAFVATRDHFYLATASADARPYVQHRGGPPGFLKVIDARTLAFADFGGNRQYITVGNLSENDRVHLFLIDYPSRQRVKVWGRARVVEDDPELLASLVVADYKARPQRAVVVSVEAWDANCSSHITQRFDEDMLREVVAKLTARIEALEGEVERLRGG